jgi:hypothetical protein
LRGRINQLLRGFAPKERDYIRRELDVLSTFPSVAEGFPLKTWRGGPQAGKPKVPPVAQGLIDRGLIQLDTSQRMPRVIFTTAGLTELRSMRADRRLADPKTFARVRQELGIDPRATMKTLAGSRDGSDSNRGSPLTT